MKTVIHTYKFDIRNADEKQAYEKLCAELKATIGRGHWMESHGGKSHYMPEFDGKTLTLDETNYFENQWNVTIEGKENSFRVFDWAQDSRYCFTGSPNGNPYIKRGHYLDITDEMRELRRNNNRCGYCGKTEPAAKGYTFCPHCIDSEYLKESELHLTRMRPIDTPFKTEREPLNAAESAYLVPLWRDAQLHGTTARGKARIEKARADIESEYKKAVADATIKRDGFRWIMDNGFQTGNVIYYSHNSTFSIGWREPLTEELKSAWLDKLAEFPFNYEFAKKK